MKYRALIEQDEDGAFVAHVPALPGCVSQGSSSEEALANIREAIEGYLESLREHDESIPRRFWKRSSSRRDALLLLTPAAGPMGLISDSDRTVSECLQMKN